MYRKKSFLFLISFLIGILLFAWVIKLVGWQEIKNAFLAFTFWQGLVIVVLTFFIILVGNFRWKIILKSIGPNISFKELLKPYFSCLSVVYFSPMVLFGGEVFRGYFLKNKHSIPWSKGMASIFIDRILDWTTNLVIVLVGMAYFLLRIGLPPFKLALIFGGAFVFWLVGISFFYFKAFKGESFAKFFLRFFISKKEYKNPFEIEQEIFDFFKKKRKYLLQAFSLAFLEEIIYLGRIWLLAIFSSKIIGFWPILSILGFYYLAGMIPIPASLGTNEALQVFAFAALGLGKSTGLAFTLIIRGAELVFAITGAYILYHFGIKLAEIALFKKKIVNNQGSES